MCVCDVYTLRTSVSIYLFGRLENARFASPPPPPPRDYVVVFLVPLPPLPINSTTILITTTVHADGAVAGEFVTARARADRVRWRRRFRNAITRHSPHLHNILRYTYTCKLYFLYTRTLNTAHTCIQGADDVQRSARDSRVTDNRATNLTSAMKRNELIRRLRPDAH